MHNWANYGKWRHGKKRKELLENNIFTYPENAPAEIMNPIMEDVARQVANYENKVMSKITILWYRKETSMNFNGSMYGYKREDGVVGSFSAKLLDEYEKLFDITWLIEKKDEDE